MKRVWILPLCAALSVVGLFGAAASSVQAEGTPVASPAAASSPVAFAGYPDC